MEQRIRTSTKMDTQNIILILIISYAINAEDLCMTNSNEDVDKDTNNTIIRLTEIDAQNLNYKWEVYAKSKGKACKNVQRCNLQAWDKARDMQKYLNSYKIDEKDPLIIINSSLISPNFEYTLNLTVFEKGKNKSAKLYHLGGKNKEKLPVLQSKLGYILLTGSITTYADREYYIHAYFSFCGKEQSEKSVMSWKILNDANKLFKKIPYTGNDLQIPRKTFSANQNYAIVCTVRFKNKTLVATESLKLKILKRGLVLELNMNELTTGPNQTIKIVATVRDPDNVEPDFDLQWTCKFKGEDCPNVEEEQRAILELESGFQECGEYKITAKVSNSDGSQNKTCTINVDCDVTKGIEIYEYDAVVNPSIGIEIPAKVTNLITGCILEWTSIERDGYESLDMKKVPNENIMNVTIKADAFLNEVTEFSDDTTEKDFSLVIPPKAGAWQGLKGDVSYLFRLNVDCPEFEKTKAEKLHADVQFRTNAPPKVEPLIVNPSKGYALITKFIMTSTKATDKAEDYPLLYYYGYKNKEKTVYVTVRSEAGNVEMILPAADGEIQTMLKVCDSGGSCAESEGPKITVELPQSITDEEETKIKAEFESLMEIGDYDEAFILANMLLDTYKAFNDDFQLESIETYVTSTVNDQFERMIKRDKNDVDFKDKANALIQNTKKLAGAVQLPEELLGNLVKLRGKLNERYISNSFSNDKRSTMVLSMANAEDQTETTLDKLKHNIEVSELAITESKNNSFIEEQKTYVLETIDQNFGPFCNQLYGGKRFKLELKTVNFTLEKLNISYFRDEKYIPYASSENTMRILFDKKWSDVVKKKLCVAKAHFVKYLNQEDSVYLTRLYSSNTQSMYKREGKMENKVVMKAYTDQTCTVYFEENWHKCKRIKADSSTVRCQCDQLGYYSLAMYDSADNTGDETTISSTTVDNKDDGKTKDGDGTTKNDDGTTTDTDGKSKDDDGKTKDDNGTTKNDNDKTKDDAETTESTETTPTTTTTSTTATTPSTTVTIPSTTLSTPSTTTTTTTTTTATTTTTTTTETPPATNPSSTTTVIKTAGLISADLSTGDKISIAMICLSVAGILIMGLITTILNRAKRERTVETSDGIGGGGGGGLEFPKYSSVFDPAGLEGAP